MTDKIARLPGIDVNAGLYRVDNSVEAYRAILASFYTHYRCYSATLGKELNDWKNLRELVHRLYGSSAMIGAIQLPVLCAAFLEHTMDDEYKKSIAKICFELDKVVSGIKENEVIGARGFSYEE